MKPFNPEKELRKIQRGNKNKIILFVVLLLIVSAVSYSFALYQIRYNKQIIYTTVAPFNKRDVYLAVKVNGEYQDKFPDKENNYAFSGYECDGDATVTFDPDKWIASVNATGPDKCTIKFGAKNINYDTLRIKEDMIVDETTDANLRYIGANPANYIWFNCLKYNDLTNENAIDDDHKCEKWRIIGIMNNMTIVNEDTEEETNNQSLIKIIRADNLGSYSWDNKDITTGAKTDVGSTNWADARLMKLLNPGYEGEEKGGSLYWNSDSGDCYSEKANATVHCDFTKKGLTNDNTRNMIENVKWNIGGYKTSLENTPQLFYEYERGETYDTNPKTWNGYIGLMYPSDYGYATNSEPISRDNCLATSLDNWDESPYQEECAKKDWLLTGNTSIEWTITHGFSGIFVADVRESGEVNGTSPYVGHFIIRPTLYLKPNVKILNGEGTNEKPYILTLNNEA